MIRVQTPLHSIVVGHTHTKLRIILPTQQPLLLSYLVQFVVGLTSRLGLEFEARTTHASICTVKAIIVVPEKLITSCLGTLFEVQKISLGLNWCIN